MTFEQMEFIGDDWNAVWDQIFCTHRFSAIDENGTLVETERCVFCGIRNKDSQANHEPQAEYV